MSVSLVSGSKVNQRIDPELPGKSDGLACSSTNEKTMKFAIPIISLNGERAACGTEGGPFLCGLCMGLCLIVTQALPPCAAACAPVCGGPTP